MSRSYKKKMAGGSTTASSERDDKKMWHKAFRRKSNMLLYQKDEEIIFPIENEMSDPWGMQKDGKGIYFTKDEIRKTLNASIQTLMNNATGREHYAFCLKNTFFNSWLIQDLCIFAGIEKNLKEIKISEILEISNEKIEEFIDHYLKLERRK
jgi:hypothetical protein